MKDSISYLFHRSDSPFFGGSFLCCYIGDFILDPAEDFLFFAVKRGFVDLCFDFSFLATICIQKVKAEDSWNIASKKALLHNK